MISMNSMNYTETLFNIGKESLNETLNIVHTHQDQFEKILNDIFMKKFYTFYDGIESIPEKYKAIHAMQEVYNKLPTCSNIQSTLGNVITLPSIQYVLRIMLPICIPVALYLDYKINGSNSYVTRGYNGIVNFGTCFKNGALYAYNGLKHYTQKKSFPKPMPIKDEKCLLAFDFDKTITNDHFYSILKRAEIQEGNATQYVDNILKGDTIINGHSRKKKGGLKGMEQLSIVMKNALNKGHHIAIVSFNTYGEVILPVLQKLVGIRGGLESKDLKNIYIRNGFPKESNACKQEHLADAMNYFNMTKKQNVILIDDDTENVETAQKNGFSGIVVLPTDNSHLDTLKEYLFSKANEHNMYNQHEQLLTTRFKN